MTIPSNLDCDIAIVGGGITGTTLACALQDSGLRVMIIEAKSLEVAVARRQAYAITLLSGRIFAGIGVWDKILPQIAQFCNIRLSDADYKGIVQFQTKDLGGKALGYVGEHSVILTALQEKIADSSNLSWLCPAEVTNVKRNESHVAIQVKVNGEERQIHTQLIIGADGARSRIRQWSNITTRGWKYWQSCIAFTIQHEHPDNDTAFERFWYSGPMGVLPLPGNRCQIVWTAPHADAKALYELKEEDFIEKLQSRLEGSLGRVKLVSDRALFPVQLMQSDRYVLPRLALVGDAAHCCHPVGGQGLNLGIRDAAALTQVLQEAHAKGEDIGSLAVLKRYQRWRKRENLTILGFTDFLDRMFSNHWFPLVTSRRLGLWMLANVPPMKRFALQLMTGLKGRPPLISKQ